MARIYKQRGAVTDVINIAPADPHFNQSHATVRYANSADFSTEVTPTGGTITCEGRPNGAGGFATLDMSPIDCTDTGDFATASVPVDAYRFTPVSIAGASHYEITVTAKAM